MSIIPKCASSELASLCCASAWRQPLGFTPIMECSLSELSTTWAFWTLLAFFVLLVVCALARFYVNSASWERPKLTSASLILCTVIGLVDSEEAFRTNRFTLESKIMFCAWFASFLLSASMVYGNMLPNVGTPSAGDSIKLRILLFLVSSSCLFILVGYVDIVGSIMVYLFWVGLLTFHLLVEAKFAAMRCKYEMQLEIVVGVVGVLGLSSMIIIEYFVGGRGYFFQSSSIEWASAVIRIFYIFVLLYASPPSETSAGTTKSRKTSVYAISQDPEAQDAKENLNKPIPNVTTPKPNTRGRISRSILALGS